MNKNGSSFTASVKRNLQFVCMCLYMGNKPCSTVVNIAKVPTICIEIACMHAQAKIALPEQLEHYLNDLIPSCFGVQISFAVPFQNDHFFLHCTHLAQTGVQWDDQMSSITPCRHTTDTL